MEEEGLPKVTPGRRHKHLQVIESDEEEACEPLRFTPKSVSRRKRVIGSDEEGEEGAPAERPHGWLRLRVGEAVTLKSSGERGNVLRIQERGTDWTVTVRVPDGGSVDVSPEV